MNNLPIEVGNAGALDTSDSGWIIGYSPWCASGPHNLRLNPPGQTARGPFLKWYAHPAGHPNGEAKPVSVGRTVALLVGPGGRFRLDFSATPDFAEGHTITHTLQQIGDYVAWGEGVYHRSFGLAPSTILTLRWEPQP